ncbi:hypothetical protein D1610_15875 [Sphingomonas gilva]|uniref:LysR family transcriptional regulator n=1 Tax=Sphingomonas gilva TaxID=2305907 RepID=A0A396RRU8_9SPHN|nr:hypothetical protein [Sphingomonas gilva]RHW16321.1 hypothetical protein D1610_15875 [Sphingomonas gilva]
MTDSPAPDAATDPLAFAPVKTAARHDGWTPARQRDFIAQLARIGVVGAAAKAVGMSAKSAYALRKRAGEGSGFAAAWAGALDIGRARALSLAIDRALNGEATPVFYRGRQIGERRRYDNRLLLAALRAIDPAARTAPADLGGGFGG